MFRLFFAMFLVLILRSFASQNESANNCGKGFLKDCNCRDGRDGRDGQNGKDGRDGRDGNGAVKGDKGERGSQGIAGKNGEKGQKGERGSPGSPGSPDGARVIQFSDTADKCIPRIAGTVRYNATQKTLLLCDGSAWLPLLAAGKGHAASKPGRHCLDILNSGEDFNYSYHREKKK